MTVLATFLLAQATANGDWATTALTATGPAGLVGVVLWKIHQDSIKRWSARELALREDNRKLTARLFLLADRATETGAVAAEVAHSDGADPRVLAAVEELRALLEARDA